MDEQLFIQHDEAYAAAESARLLRDMQEPADVAPSPADEYMDLLAFVERVAKARYEDTHQRLIEDARRLIAVEEIAEVHLDNECPECEGAGWFDNDDPNGLEKCIPCDGTGNAVRRLP